MRFCTKISLLSNKHILLLILFFCFCISSQASKLEKNANNGIIDLQQHDFDSMPLVKLGGEWLFWGDHLSLADDSIKQFGKKCVILKDNWTDLGYKEYGYGTYMVQILVNKKHCKQYSKNQLGFRIRNVFSAYKLYINKKLVAQKGIISQQETLDNAELGYETIFFTPTNDSLTLILQVSNYLNPISQGIHEKIILGSQKQIFSEVMFRNYLFSFGFGILMFFMLYHLMFYFRRTKERDNLYFAIICGIFALKCLYDGDKMILNFFPHLPIVVFYKVWFLSVIIMLCLTLFYHTLFPKEIPKIIVRIAFVVFAVYCIAILVCPVSYGFILEQIIYLFSLPLNLVVTAGVGLAVVRKRKYAWPSFIGIIVPASLGINDLLFALNIIHTGLYVSVGFIYYVVFQSITLSYKSANAFYKVEKLTKELGDANQHLEIVVANRTAELHNANAELLQTNATKDRFFSILAHDLRGPISTIRALLQLITERHESYSKEKITLMVTVLSESSRSAYELLENLLYWAKAQRKEMLFNAETCNLHEIVQENITLFLSAAHQKNIKLTNTVVETQMIFCDRNMVTTIVRNLLNNAIKFTPNDGSVRISANETTQGVQIIIVDTGVGMSKDVANALFSKEVVLQSSYGTAGEKGSGLGLVLCREFIAMHGGSILVESEIDKGSTFTVFIPSK